MIRFVDASPPEKPARAAKAADVVATSEPAPLPAKRGRPRKAAKAA